MEKKKKKKVVKKKKVKKGFTLIELLAVIIILGVIMLIAIPSVTKYINDSRKDTYVDTAKQIVKGAIPLVNGGELDVYDTDTTYYIPAKCVPTENSMSSPFGEFVNAYVIVGYTGEGYEYYWASVDTAHQGIEIKDYNKLSRDDVKPNVEKIEPNIGIGNRTQLRILDEEGCQGFNSPVLPAQIMNNTGEIVDNPAAQPTAANIIGAVPGLKVVSPQIKLFNGANPSNYVSFNGELWRVIGVYGNTVKIIRTEPIANDKWNNGSNNNWSNSVVQNYLYNTYYPTLSNTAKSMIETNATWYIGPGNWEDNAAASYTRALGKTWTGKIGLVAVYEYLYALGDSCTSPNGYNLGSCDNWIYNSLINNGFIFRAWTMSYDPRIPGNVYLVYRSGKSIDVHGVVDACGITPVVYLKSSVNITGGTGTSGDPYILSLE